MAKVDKGGLKLHNQRIDDQPFYHNFRARLLIFLSQLLLVLLHDH